MVSKQEQIEQAINENNLDQLKDLLKGISVIEEYNAYSALKSACKKNDYNQDIIKEIIKFNKERACYYKPREALFTLKWVIDNELLDKNQEVFFEAYDDLLNSIPEKGDITKNFIIDEIIEYVEDKAKNSYKKYEKYFEIIYSYHLKENTPQILEEKLLEEISTPNSTKVKCLLEHMSKDNENSIENVFREIIESKRRANLNRLEQFFPYIKDKQLITKLIEKFVSEYEIFSTHSKDVGSDVKKFFNNDVIKENLPSPEKLNNLLKEKILDLKNNYDNSNSQHSKNLLLLLKKDLVLMGVDPKIFNDHPGFQLANISSFNLELLKLSGDNRYITASNQKDQKKELFKIAKQYESEFKSKKYASKEAVLDLVDRVIDTIKKDKESTPEDKDKAIKIVKDEFKKAGKLTDKVIDEVVEFTKEIEGKAKGSRSFRTKLIEGIKKIFKNEAKKNIQNHREETFKELNDQGFKEAKNKLKMMMKSEDQEALTHKNTRDMNPSKPSSKSIS
ncbi:MAG: hypothetical protein ACK4OM_04680 [Alphaproteobacteria bacterium]